MLTCSVGQEERFFRQGVPMLRRDPFCPAPMGVSSVLTNHAKCKSVSWSLERIVHKGLNCS